MVTVFLRGGLGNQMFQYAAGLALAEKNNTGVRLDTVFLNDRIPRRQFTYRAYDLGVFELDQRFTRIAKISNAMPVPGLWLAFDLATIRMADMMGTQKMLRERREHELDPAALGANGNVLLWGRWQNEGYFHTIEPQLRKAFRFRAPLSGEAKAIAERMKGDHSVSLHVRRGDFASFKGVEALHGKTNLSYYEAAVKYIASKVKDPSFFVVSDDVAWCRDNLRLDGPTEYIPLEAAGPHDAFHLELMSLCRHHIIANSTFSWWGAWLDPRPDKIVIAPKHWYADREEQPEIIPAGWVKI